MMPYGAHVRCQDETNKVDEHSSPLAAFGPSSETIMSINLSKAEDLVTVMYCNEVFDPGKPDTFFEAV